MEEWGEEDGDGCCGAVWGQQDMKNDMTFCQYILFISLSVAILSTIFSIVMEQVRFKYGYTMPIIKKVHNYIKKKENIEDEIVVQYTMGRYINFLFEYLAVMCLAYFFLKSYCHMAISILSLLFLARLFFMIFDAAFITDKRITILSVMLRPITLDIGNISAELYYKWGYVSTLHRRIMIRSNGKKYYIPYIKNRDMIDNRFVNLIVW